MINITDAAEHKSLLTFHIQTVSASHFALTVQHCEAPLVRHLDRVQCHLFLRHTEAPHVFLGQHLRLVVQHQGGGLGSVMYLRLIGRSQSGPEVRRERK